jgi:hypothetical protein
MKHYYRVLKQEFHRYKEILHYNLDTSVLQDNTKEALDKDYYDLDTACAS